MKVEEFQVGNQFNVLKKLLEQKHIEVGKLYIFFFFDLLLNFILGS